MHLRSFGLVVGGALLLAQSGGCGDSERAADGTAVGGSGGSGGDGTGGSAGEAGASDAGGTRSDTGGTRGDTAGTGGDAGGTRGDGGTAGAAAGTNTGGSGAAAGAAGAGGSDEWLPTCDEIPHEDPADDCEPVLRAIVKSGKGVRPLLTIAYDSMGRVVSVGDQRDHASYALYRYTYDEAGRLTHLKKSCSDADSCQDVYEFSYAEAGWLQAMTLFSSRIEDRNETYAEDGSLIESRWEGESAEFGTTYTYRSDGQVELSESFRIDENGDHVYSGARRIYEYGDDSLLDAIACYDSDSEEDWDCYETFGYIIDAGKVRVMRRDSDNGDLSEAFVLDRRGLPAFEHVTVQGDDQTASVILDGARLPEMWKAKPRPGYLDLPIDVAASFGPYAVSQGEVDSFSFAYHGYSFDRAVTFADDGLLEHLVAEWSGPEDPGSVELRSQRCDGVVLETVRTTRWNDSDTEVSYYYYGCDDFVLPAAPPLP